MIMTSLCIFILLSVTALELSDQCPLILKWSRCTTYPCQNNGQCENVSTYPGFTCKCPPGFTGFLCVDTAEELLYTPLITTTTTTPTATTTPTTTRTPTTTTTKPTTTTTPISTTKPTTTTTPTTTSTSPTTTTSTTTTSTTPTTQCMPGYHLVNGGGCSDIDECKTNCKMSNQICINTDGGYLCQTSCNHTEGFYKHNDTACRNCGKTRVGDERQWKPNVTNFDIFHYDWEGGCDEDCLCETQPCHIDSGLCSDHDLCSNHEVVSGPGCNDIGSCPTIDDWGLYCHRFCSCWNGCEKLSGACIDLEGCSMDETTYFGPFCSNIINRSCNQTGVNSCRDDQVCFEYGKSAGQCECIDEDKVKDTGDNNLCKFKAYKDCECPHFCDTHPTVPVLDNPCPAGTKCEQFSKTGFVCVYPI